MSNYQLVIKMPIEAMDDIDARQKAKELIENVNIIGFSSKLQRLYQDKEPRGIDLNLPEPIIGNDM